MDILNQTVETVAIGALSPHPRNVNQGDIGAIHQSIEVNGFWGTVVAQRSTGHILAGNHRWMAAKQSGAEEIPVAWVDVDDEAALRILLADNRTTRLGHDDPQGLADLLKELLDSTGTLDGTGFDPDDLDELLADIGEKPSAGEDPGAQTDRAEELREKWGTERGQIWAIPSASVPGNSHRLMCGDSTSAEDVARLLAGAEPRLMVTDPPYGVDYDPSWRQDALGPDAERRLGQVENDGTADWTEAWRLFPGVVTYCWHADRHASTVQASLEAAGFEIRCQIIWAKDRMAISRGAYHWQHEPCWYAVRKGGTAEWVGDRSQTTLWQIGVMAVGDADMKTHGTQKPLECMERPVRHHAGDVYEPFAGSGTTLVASERQARTCYAIELSPAYVAVILERLTGMGLSPHRVTRDEA